MFICTCPLAQGHKQVGRKNSQAEKERDVWVDESLDGGARERPAPQDREDDSGQSWPGWLGAQAGVASRARVWSKGALAALAAAHRTGRRA